MTRFRFRLESVLGWRRAQLEAEEFRLQPLLEAVARVEREIAAIDQARSVAEGEVRASGAVSAPELWALSAYREAAQARAVSLAARRRECGVEVERQRERIAAARRRCRLLERLRERRLGDWEYQQIRELDTFASDAFLARWKRGTGDPPR